MARLRERMGPEELERAWAEGTALADEEAVAYATRGRGRRDRPAKGLDWLTPTECDIAALGRRGGDQPRDRRAALRPRQTVQSHLRNVYVKLDVCSRRQLAQVVPGEA